MANTHFVKNEDLESVDLQKIADSLDQECLACKKDIQSKKVWITSFAVVDSFELQIGREYFLVCKDCWNIIYEPYFDSL